jgi:hypothetical protein
MGKERIEIMEKGMIGSEKRRIDQTEIGHALGPSGGTMSKTPDV